MDAADRTGKLRISGPLTALVCGLNAEMIQYFEKLDDSIRFQDAVTGRCPLVVVEERVSEVATALELIEECTRSVCGRIGIDVALGPVPVSLYGLTYSDRLEPFLPTARALRTAWL